MTWLLSSEELQHIRLVQWIYAVKTDRRLTGHIDTRNLASASEKELLTKC